MNRLSSTVVPVLLSLSKCIAWTFSYRRNGLLGGIKSVAESIPPGESVPRSRLKVTINFNTPLILSPFPHIQLSKTKIRPSNTL